MAVVNELIRVESDGTISFGDYTLETKAKLDNFKHEGNSYKVKTYKDITKLECNDVFVYESVPGTTVSNFTTIKGDVTFDKLSFGIEGQEGAQITLGLEPDAEFEVFINDESVGTMSTNLGGKLSLSVEMEADTTITITIEKR